MIAVHDRGLRRFSSGVTRQAEPGKDSSDELHAAGLGSLIGSRPQ